MINNNTWNRIRYTLYVPIYDPVARYFYGSRKAAIESLQIQAGARVLIVGGGTGLDLEHLPANVQITATDITPAMVSVMKKRSELLHLQTTVMVMDGQKLDLPDNSADHILLHLILAVIPDPVACIREAERVLKPGGTISVFDKFMPAGKKKSLLRVLLNPVSNFLATDITRVAEDLIANTSLQVIQDTPANLGGQFRRIILRK